MSEPFSVQRERALSIKPVSAGDRMIQAGFSLRRGGISRGTFASLNLGLHVSDDPEAVVENRRRLAEDLGFPVEKWVSAEQVHGIRIMRVAQAEAGAGATKLATAVAGADGLYTTESGLLLTLCFADCVPIYFYARKVPAVGMLHAGWRGSAGRAAAGMTALWARDLKVAPADVDVIIGPAIDGADYEVDERVMAEVRKLDKSVWRDAAVAHGKGHFLLDLRALNRNILIQAGVPEQRIVCSGYSTVRCPEWFYSFRRDGGSTGRMMGFIGMKEKVKVDSPGKYENC